MNKVVIGTIGGLVLGAASGYFVAEKGEEAVEKQSSFTQSVLDSQRAPRFGSSDGEETGPSAKAKAAAKAKGDLNSILKERNMSKRAGQLIEYYNSLSPAELMEEAKRLNSLSWDDRMVASNLLFAKWAETAPVQAMEFANKLGFRSMMEKGTILQTWSSMNPEAAAAYYNENRNIMNDRSAGIIAGEWARLNPEAALEWSKNLTGRNRENALRSLFSSFADTDPAAAAQRAASLSEEELSGSNVYGTIAAQWAKKDWAAAEAWLSTLPADQQESARQRAVESLAITQVAGMAEGEAKNNAVAAVARAMAVENPAMAADLILKNSSGEQGRQSGRAVGEVIGSWVYSDPAAAKSWITSLSEGSVKDSALMAYAMQSPSTDYLEKINMTSGMSNERMREFATEMAARNWMREDSQAAQAWIESSNLSDRVKQNLTNPERRGGPGRQGPGGPRGGGPRGGRP